MVALNKVLEDTEDCLDGDNVNEANSIDDDASNIRPLMQWNPGEKCTLSISRPSTPKRKNGCEGTQNSILKGYNKCATAANGSEHLGALWKANAWALMGQL